jgi:hypothetical protein
MSLNLKAAMSLRRTMSEIYRPSSSSRVSKEQVDGDNGLQFERPDLRYLCGIKLKIYGLTSQPFLWDFFSFDTVRTVIKTIRDQLNISRSVGELITVWERESVGELITVGE